MARIYRLSKLKMIAPEEYKLWNDGLAKMREGMPDHEVVREIEALRAVAARASSTVVPASSTKILSSRSIA